jgi:hypothetical protein
MVKRFLILLMLAFTFIASAQEKVQLRWNPSTDNVGVEGYNVWVNGEYYGTTSDTFFIFPVLDPAEYAMGVSAFDAAGNESEKSLTLYVLIDDVTGPSVPDSLMIVYPNPTYNGNFIVEFGRGVKENTVLQVLTTTGKVIHERYIDPFNGTNIERFNMQDTIAPGLYILALIEDGTRIGYTVLTVAKAGGLPYRSVGLYRDDYKGVWEVLEKDKGEILAIWN